MLLYKLGSLLGRGRLGGDGGRDGAAAVLLVDVGRQRALPRAREVAVLALLQAAAGVHLAHVRGQGQLRHGAVAALRALEQRRCKNVAYGNEKL